MVMKLVHLVIVLYIDGTAADSSFLTSSGANAVPSNLLNISMQITDYGSISWIVPIGTYVHKNGAYSKLTGGHVLSNVASMQISYANNTVVYRLHDMTRANFYSEPGDSGGPVFVIDTSTNVARIVGVHTARNTINVYDTTFSKYSNIAYMMNIVILR